MQESLIRSRLLDNPGVSPGVYVRCKQTALPGAGCNVISFVRVGL